MNNTIKKILEEQEMMNARSFSAIVPRQTGELLHILIKLRKPKRVLEIGTSIGYSAIWIASALEKGAKLICIDHWAERVAIAQNFFKRSKLPITLIQGEALKIIPALKERFDVVFLDATKSEYLKYLKAVKLNKNSLILADNAISHAGKMQDFLAYIRKNKGVVIPIGSGMAVLMR